MAPPSLSTMSMSITTQASSDSFVSAAAAAGLCPKDEADFPKKFSSSALASSDGNPGAAARPESESEGQTQLSRARAGGEAESEEESGHKLLSYDEIMRRKREGEALIVVDENVYDVTQFLETHPGGAELILEHLQASDGVQEAGSLMRGKVDEDGHSHSKAAFRMLEQFFVGTVKAAPGAVQSEARGGKKYCFTVDFTKPIVKQVGHLGADYDQWVHDPIISRESPRFFESDIHELCVGYVPKTVTRNVVDFVELHGSIAEK